MISKVDPVKEEWLIEFRDCMFMTEDIKTAMVLFVMGAKNFIDVNSLVLIISTGENKTYYVAELSTHSPRALIQLNHYPLRILSMITRRWKQETFIKTPLGNHSFTIGYLAAGSHKAFGSGVEEALMWENLVALASVVFMKFIQPDTNKNFDGKNQKRKRTQFLRT
jgi:hypothetical protein